MSGKITAGDFVWWANTGIGQAQLQQAQASAQTQMQQALNNQSSAGYGRVAVIPARYYTNALKGNGADSETVDDGSAANGRPEGIGIAEAQARLGIAAWTKIYNEGGSDHRLQAVTSGELRPPPEHDGKSWHWVQKDGDEPEVMAWYQTEWLEIGAVTETSPKEGCSQGYRYLGPAEWDYGDGKRAVAAAESAMRANSELLDERYAKVEQIGALICERDQLRRENAELAAKNEALIALTGSLSAAVLRPKVPQDSLSPFPANALKHSR